MASRFWKAPGDGFGGRSAAGRQRSRGRRATGGAADFTGGGCRLYEGAALRGGHGRGAVRVRDFRRATTGSVEEIYEIEQKSTIERKRKPEGGGKGVGNDSDGRIRQRPPGVASGTDRIARGRGAL